MRYSILVMKDGENCFLWSRERTSQGYTPVSGILTGKKYAKQYTTNLVLILYIRILNI